MTGLDGLTETNFVSDKDAVIPGIQELQQRLELISLEDGLGGLQRRDRVVACIPDLVGSIDAGKVRIGPVNTLRAAIKRIAVVCDRYESGFQGGFALAVLEDNVIKLLSGSLGVDLDDDTVLTGVDGLDVISDVELRHGKLDYFFLKVYVIVPSAISGAS